MLDKYKENQRAFYNFITKSFVNNKLSHAYLIQTNGISYAFSLAKDLAKFFLCNGEFDKDICNSVDNATCDNFIMIDSDSIIKKESVLDLQKSFSLKTLENDARKVYLVKDASSLNDSSANSLLKFLEEPEDDIIAILLANNIDDVKETIKSRCQVINLVNNSFDYKDLFDYCDLDADDKNATIEKEYTSFLNFYNNLEKKGILVLKDNNNYVFAEKIEYLLKFGMYLYFDLINDILNSTNKFFLPDSAEKKEICERNDINSLVQKIKLINKFLKLKRYNVNTNLFFDNFVIKFGGE